MLSVMDRLTLYRAIRITVMLSIAVALWLLLGIDRGYWIAMTLMIIYMPFEPGLVNNRIKMRLIGTIVGLLFGFLLVELLRAHLVWLALIPLLIIFALYFSIVHYTYATVFITMGVMLMFSMLDTRGMSPLTFMLARFVDTFIACVLCFIAEVIFRPKKMIEHAILKDLEDILSAYIKHFEIMYKAFINDQFYQISIEEAVKFNHSLLSLKQSAELNKTKLCKEKQSLMEACLFPVFKMRAHLISVHYLAESYQLEMQEFVRENKEVLLFMTQDLKRILSDQMLREDQLKELSMAMNTAHELSKQLKTNLLSFYQLAVNAQKALNNFKTM